MRYGARWVDVVDGAMEIASLIAGGTYGAVVAVVDGLRERVPLIAGC